MRALPALLPALLIKSFAPSGALQFPVYGAHQHFRRASRSIGNRFLMEVRGGGETPPSVDSRRGGEDVLTTRPVRILALHGFSQDAESFRSKTGALRKGLKDQLEMVYIDAPCKDTHSSIGEGRSWYEFSKVDENGNMMWEKFEETLLYIDQVFKEQGPFDAVLGFSQGACVVAMLAALQERAEAPPHVRFPACLLFSGFAPRDAKWTAICAQQTVSSVRSLHVIGDKDTLVTPDRSLQLAEMFEGAEVVRHNKGHLVPSDRSVRDAFRAFIFAQPSAAAAPPNPSEPAEEQAS